MTSMTSFRATFETWLIAHDEMTLVRQIPGRYTIEIRLKESGGRSIYRAYVLPTLQPLQKTFGLSQLRECKVYVESQFKKKISDWEEC